MYPHRIRLRGPWSFEPLARTLVHPDGRREPLPGSVPAPGRMPVPASWHGTVLDGFRGLVRWRRHFHAPSTLEPHERLWLVFDAVDYFAEASLNRALLGRHEGYFDRFEFDVTDQIRSGNDLSVEVDCPDEAIPRQRRLIRGSLETLPSPFAAGLWGDVVLEVRSFAWLQRVTVLPEWEDPGGTLTVTGQVIGSGSSPVSLDLSMQGAWLAALKLDASPYGTDFKFSVKLPSVSPWWPRHLGTPHTYRIDLELHANAVTLDHVERHTGFRRLIIDAQGQQAELNGRRLPVVWATLPSGDDPLSLAAADLTQLQQPLPFEREPSVILRQVPARVLRADAYDTADVHGVLICQYFPLLGEYVDSSALEQEAARQAQAMAQQLGHHPSIALWCCRYDAASQGMTLENSVQRAINQQDPTRICLISSPALLG
jgi:beta-mannosidase